MQLMVDSKEPLESVLLVVGAMYRVELSVATQTDPAPAPATSTATRNGTRKRSRKTARKAPAAPAGGGRRGRRRVVDSADVRAWARANGHAVKDRGRVPAAVVDAYRDSGTAN
jgi:hypothetical protein